MKEYTGCDGLMVARGARGNPWIFREIKEYLENGNVIDKPTINDIREMIIRHAKMLVDYKGEYTGIREMRKHIAWYTAGLPHSAELRRMCNQIETMENLVETVNAKLQ